MNQIYWFLAVIKPTLSKYIFLFVVYFYVTTCMCVNYWFIEFAICTESKRD